MQTDVDMMRRALAMARQAADTGEVPVGAVAVLDGEVLAEVHNSPISLQDPTAHAEVLALRAAAKARGAYRLPGLELYVTLEPCLMCFGALLHARVARLVYAASDPKVGFSRTFSSIPVEARFNHTIEIVPGVLAEESSKLLKNFFRDRR